MGKPRRTYNQPRLSPDGRRIAVDVISGPQAMQIWLYDLAQDTLTPLTFEGLNRHATWTPDGRRIVFMLNRDGVTQLYWQPIDGSGDAQRLTQNAPTATAGILDLPYSWSRGGEVLTYARVDPTKGAEFWMLDVTGSATPAGRPNEAERLALEVRSADGGPQFSPDGRWLAYASDDASGLRQVYVQPYPGPGGKWQIRGRQAQASVHRGVREDRDRVGASELRCDAGRAAVR